MNQGTINKLNTLNYEFYAKFANEFDTSRQTLWQGWTDLFTYLTAQNFKPNTILDVGCGNGRFVASALAGLNQPFNYLGIDSNQYLIEQAQSKYSSIKIKSKLQDIFTELNLHKQFDLMVAFGVMHHIPTYELRLEFLLKLKSLLQNNGKIVFTCWNFTSLKLFKSHLTEAEIITLQINPQELTENDYLLRWANSSEYFRYCHNYTRDEIERLLIDTGLKLEHGYEADGKNSKTNRYYVITK